MKENTDLLDEIINKLLILREIFNNEKDSLDNLQTELTVTNNEMSELSKKKNILISKINKINGIEGESIEQDRELIKENYRKTQQEKWTEEGLRICKKSKDVEADIERTYLKSLKFFPDLNKKKYISEIKMRLKKEAKDEN